MLALASIRSPWRAPRLLLLPALFLHPAASLLAGRHPNAKEDNRRPRPQARSLASTGPAAAAASSSPSGAGGSASAAAREGPFYERLHNSLDIQYMGTVEVGGEKLRGLFDTGSFDLLVFGEQCSTCGTAVAYHHSRSRTFVAGKQKETYSFGSGLCHTVEAYEEVKMGPFAAERQPFWEVQRAEMPVLGQASFQAIIGIGPPGEAAATAEAALEELRRREEEYSLIYGFVSREITEQRAELQEKLDAARQRKSLLQSLGVRKFSTCLGRGSGTSGWLVWNDYDPEHRAEKFFRLPVAGVSTWSVEVKNIAFAGMPGFSPGSSALGCQNGCGAIIDTGTSLFGVPTHVYQKMYNFMRSMNGDCSNLAKFPDLVMTVGGHELRFPPDSYIGQMVGHVPQAMKKLVHASMDVAAYGDGEAAPGGGGIMVRLDQHRRGRNSTQSLTRQRRRQACQLLLMDMGEELTQLGPLAILGMPFFREYYTTFDIASIPRAVHVAPADEQCMPAGATSALNARRKKRRLPRRVQVEKLRLPRWPRNGSFVQI